MGRFLLLHGISFSFPWSPLSGSPCSPLVPMTSLRDLVPSSLPSPKQQPGSQPLPGSAARGGFSRRGFGPCGPAPWPSLILDWGVRFNRGQRICCVVDSTAWQETWCKPSAHLGHFVVFILKRYTVFSYQTVQRGKLKWSTISPPRLLFNMLKQGKNKCQLSYSHALFCSFVR